MPVSERGLITRIRERVGAPPGWVHIGIGDDAAVVAAARNALEVLTTDALVEGVHWDPRFCSAADVGHKSLAVNLSDLAAMGAQPRAALLALSVPAGWADREADPFIDAFAALAREHGVAVIGGNVTASPGPAMISVTLTGFVRPRRTLARSGGRAGDELYVSGTIGSALAGLLYLREHPSLEGPADAGVAECVARYRRPDARVRLGLLLGRNQVASACMDLSDGLADAVRGIATASGTGARLDAALLPLSERAAALFRARGEDPAVAAVAGGDDYELLFAVPPKRHRALDAVRRLTRGLPLTKIGTLTKEPGIVMVQNGQERDLPEGFSHF